MKSVLACLFVFWFAAFACGAILTPPANKKFSRYVSQVAVTGNGAILNGLSVAIHITRDGTILNSAAGNTNGANYAINVPIPSNGDWGVGKATIEEYLDSSTVTDTREIEFVGTGGGGSGGGIE